MIAIVSPGDVRSGISIIPVMDAADTLPMQQERVQRSTRNQNKWV